MAECYTEIENFLISNFIIHNRRPMVKFYGVNFFHGRIAEGRFGVVEDGSA